MVLKLDKGILHHMPIMKTNGGLMVTQYDQTGCEYCGSMKIDLLSLSALDKMDTCIQLLQQDNKIETGLTRKEIYDKYIHPDVIEWDNKEMFELLYNGDLPDAFQFDSNVGKKAIQEILPHSIDEITIGNSLMRLSAKGEPPLKKFARFKRTNAEDWYKEMIEEGLTEDEMDVLKEHLLYAYGIANTQEDIMEMAMNPKISNFTLAEANKLRKAIAKLKAKDTFEAIKNLFYSKGEEAGSRKEFLDYVWNKQFAMSFNYAFSRNHCKPYSVILLQELNLAYRFGAIYWKTAVLTEKIGDNGGVAVAVNTMDNIKNPDINLSGKFFKPYAIENKILYGLLSIDGIGKDIVDVVMENRPYSNIDDIFSKLVDTKKISLLNLFTLAKSGAFDSLAPGKDRRGIMIELVERITPPKDKLTMTNVTKIADRLPVQFDKEKAWYWFRNIYLKKCKKDELNFYAPIKALDWVNSNLDIDYSIEKDVVIDIKKFEKAYKKAIIPIQNWLCTSEALELHRRALCRENWNLYCSGDFASWEMETVYFYSKYHEIDNYNLSTMFRVVDFKTLSDEPIIEEVKTSKKGKQYNVYKLSTIAGTVVNKNKDKNIVYLLTKTGIVPMKLYDAVYKKLDKKITKGEGKKKQTLDPSWFERGTKLIVTGYRRGDEFIPKVNNFNSPILKLLGKDGNNQLNIQYEKKFA